MAYWDSLLNVETHAYQPQQWRIGLDETIAMTEFFSRQGAVEDKFYPPLGCRRVENAIMGAGVYKNIKVDGYAEFMWVWNNSGSALTQGQFVVRRANQAITNLDSGGVNYGTKAATFTANKEFGGLVYVLDDAGAAGAAPENGIGKIYRNDAATIYFQPELSTALAANDDLVIIYNSHVLAGASGALRGDFRGFVVASGGIPDGYGGWVCYKADAVAALGIAAGTTITASKGLIGANGGLLTNGSSADESVILAYGLHQLTTDSVGRFILVSVDAQFARQVSA